MTRFEDQNGPMKVAAVILAAGASTRFGSPKQRAPLGSGTMLSAVSVIAHRAGLAPVIAVVPSGVAVPPDVIAEVNDQPAAGLSHSLRLGLAAVPA
ncbi:MAG: NTP transferase domain-containing protein, partial [Candidatus Limnocylindria bacterium]